MLVLIAVAFASLAITGYMVHTTEPEQQAWEAANKYELLRRRWGELPR